MIPNKQNGSSLIEVLISLGILAVGILGLSAMQSSSLRSNLNAYTRTQATIYSNDIIERMRANTLGMIADNYHNISANAAVSGCFSTGCTASDLATTDIFQWQTALAADFPQGWGVVCRDSSPEDGDPGSPACTGGADDLYAIKIWWDSDRDGLVELNSVLSFQP